MKRAIEFEETVRTIHRVVVDANDEDELDQICGFSGDSFDDIIAGIEENTGAKLLEVSERYSTDNTWLVEYRYDYWTEEEQKMFPD